MDKLDGCMILCRLRTDAAKRTKPTDITDACYYAYLIVVRNEELVTHIVT